MTTLHIRHRLRGMRTRRQWHKAISFMVATLAALAVTVAGLFWIDGQLARADEAETKAIRATHKVSHLERTWVSCLENKAVWINDEAHSCQVINTRLARGDFK